MKKLFIVRLFAIFIFALGACLMSYSQSHGEPTYIGQVKMIFEDGSSVMLNQEYCREVAKSDIYISTTKSFVIANASNRIQFPDRQEFAVMSMDEDVKLIVRVPNYDYSPQAQIEINVIKNNLQGRYLGNNITYTAEPYGKSSFLITLPASVEGEIAVRVTGCGNMVSTMLIEYNERFYQKKIQRVLDHLFANNIELRRTQGGSTIYDINTKTYILQKHFIDMYGVRMMYKLDNAYTAAVRKRKQELHNREEAQRIEQKRKEKEMRKAQKLRHGQ